MNVKGQHKGEIVDEINSCSPVDKTKENCSYFFEKRGGFEEQQHKITPN